MFMTVTIEVKDTKKPDTIEELLKRAISWEIHVWQETRPVISVDDSANTGHGLERFYGPSSIPIR